MCEALRDLFQDELKEQYQVGEANGVSKGIRKGIVKGKNEIIQNMYINHFSIAQIALATNMSEKEVKTILNIMN